MLKILPLPRHSFRRGWLALAAALFSCVAYAQIGSPISGAISFQYFNTQSGAPVVNAGGKVCTYQAGSSTPLATFSDPQLMSANTNPVVLDGTGMPKDGGGIYIGATNYKIVLRTAGSDGTCSTGTILWTRDFVTAAGAGVLAIASGGTGTSTPGLVAGTGISITGSWPNNTISASVGGYTVYHATYKFSTDGGATGLITPSINATIPTRFVIQNVALNSTTAVTSGGMATVSVGLSAGGGGAAALVAATPVASWSLNAFIQGIPVPQTASTWIKMTAPGQLTITVGTAALTAGVIEIYLFGYLSAT